MGFERGEFWRRLGVFIPVALCCVAWQAVNLSAADEWIEVKSQNFTVVSNAGERSSRRLVWQLEQIRSATIALWSFARPTLDKPLVVLAAKDEATMRLLAPEDRQVRGGVRPVSVWVTGPDAHYLAIRADVEIDTRATVIRVPGGVSRLHRAGVGRELRTRTAAVVPERVHRVPEQHDCRRGSHPARDADAVASRAVARTADHAARQAPRGEKERSRDHQRRPTVAIRCADLGVYALPDLFGRKQTVGKSESVCQADGRGAARG